jgi:glycosyltransferase involved in cell wall biosynthesis
MRIGVDGRALTGRFTGDRTYWRGLLGALPLIDPSIEFLIYSRTEIPAGELPEVANVTCRVVAAHNDRLWTLAALPQALRRDGADLIHVQYTAPPARLCPCPIITTVHDISFRLYPQWFPLRHRLLLNLTVPASMRRAACVITDSASSRRDMLRVYGLSEERLVAIPLGLPPGFAPASRGTASPGEGEGGSVDRSGVGQETERRRLKESYGIDGPYVLAVGVLQPRKNLNLLAEAFGRARTRNQLPHRLVLVGKAGWGTARETLQESARRGGGAAAADAVRFTGYVVDADLPALYRNCDAFAYPSLYEGFGLPPLEAMACAAPVLVSDAPPMPEVAGDAALIVGATDLEGWADALGRVLTDADLRADLRRRGPAHAARYTWEETARRTLAVYRQALQGRPK